MDHGTLAILLIFGTPFVAVVGGLCIKGKVASHESQERPSFKDFAFA